MADLIHRHDGASGAFPVRGIGRADETIYVLEARHAAGAYAVPKADFYRFTMQLSGRQRLSRFEVNGLQRRPPATATQGTVSFVPPGRELRAVMEGDGFHGFRILIPRAVMQRVAAEVLERPVEGEEELSGYIGPPNDRMHRLSALLHEEYRVPRRGDEAIMAALSQALCVELVRSLRRDLSPGRPSAEVSPEERARILALMEEAVDGSLSLAAIADALGLEPHALSRLFRRAFGETPRRHLMRRRLDRARHLLDATDEPLAQIAGACGFSSQAHMTTAFSQHVGVTPARYRAARHR